MRLSACIDHPRNVVFRGQRLDARGEWLLEGILVGSE